MAALQRRTQILIALAALGAAGMFLGPDGWLGIDIGRVGAAVLYATIWLFVVHLSRSPEGIFPEQASPAERQGWVALAFVSLIACHFLNFIAALPSLGVAADYISNPASRRFGINLGLLLVAWIVVGGILRAQNGEGVEADERDLRIQHSAQRTAGGLLSALIIAFVALLAIFPEQAQQWMRPLIVGNLLLGLLIARTLTESIYLVARYSRERR
jgi:hypothetical protein